MATDGSESPWRPPYAISGSQIEPVFQYTYTKTPSEKPGSSNAATLPTERIARYSEGESGSIYIAANDDAILDELPSDGEDDDEWTKIIPDGLTPQQYAATSRPESPEPETREPYRPETLCFDAPRGKDFRPPKFSQTAEHIRLYVACSNLCVELRLIRRHMRKPAVVRARHSLHFALSPPRPKLPANAAWLDWVREEHDRILEEHGQFVSAPTITPMPPQQWADEEECFDRMVTFWQHACEWYNLRKHEEVFVRMCILANRDKDARQLAHARKPSPDVLSAVVPMRITREIYADDAMAPRRLRHHHWWAFARVAPPPGFDQDCTIVILSNVNYVPPIPLARYVVIRKDGHFGPQERSRFPDFHIKYGWHWAFIPTEPYGRVAEYLEHNRLAGQMEFYKVDLELHFRTYDSRRYKPKAGLEAAIDRYWSRLTQTLKELDVPKRLQPFRPYHAEDAGSRAKAFLFNQWLTPRVVHETVAGWQRAVAELRGWIKYVRSTLWLERFVANSRRKIPIAADLRIRPFRQATRGVFTDDEYVAGLYAQFGVPVWLVQGHKTPFWSADPSNDEVQVSPPYVCETRAYADAGGQPAYLTGIQDYWPPPDEMQVLEKQLQHYGAQPGDPPQHSDNYGKRRDDSDFQRPTGPPQYAQDRYDWRSRGPSQSRASSSSRSGWRDEDIAMPDYNDQGPSWDTYTRYPPSSRSGGRQPAGRDYSDQRPGPTSNKYAESRGSSHSHARQLDGAVHPQSAWQARTREGLPPTSTLAPNEPSLAPEKRGRSNKSEASKKRKRVEGLHLPKGASTKRLKAYPGWWPESWGVAAAAVFDIKVVDAERIRGGWTDPYHPVPKGDGLVAKFASPVVEHFGGSATERNRTKLFSGYVQLRNTLLYAIRTTAIRNLQLFPARIWKKILSGHTEPSQEAELLARLGFQAEVPLVDIEEVAPAFEAIKLVDALETDQSSTLASTRPTSPTSSAPPPTSTAATSRAVTPHNDDDDEEEYDEPYNPYDSGSEPDMTYRPRNGPTPPPPPPRYFVPLSESCSPPLLRAAQRYEVEPSAWRFKARGQRRANDDFTWWTEQDSATNEDDVLEFVFTGKQKVKEYMEDHYAWDSWWCYERRWVFVFDSRPSRSEGSLSGERLSQPLRLYECNGSKSKPRFKEGTAEKPLQLRLWHSQSMDTLVQVPDGATGPVGWRARPDPVPKPGQTLESRHKWHLDDADYSILFPTAPRHILRPQLIFDKENDIARMADPLLLHGGAGAPAPLASSSSSSKSTLLLASPADRTSPPSAVAPMDVDPSCENESTRVVFAPLLKAVLAPTAQMFFNDTALTPYDAADESGSYSWPSASERTLITWDVAELSFRLQLFQLDDKLRTLYPQDTKLHAQSNRERQLMICDIWGSDTFIPHAPNPLTDPDWILRIPAVIAFRSLLTTWPYTAIPEPQENFNEQDFLVFERAVWDAYAAVHARYQYREAAVPLVHPSDVRPRAGPPSTPIPTCDPLLAPTAAPPPSSPANSSTITPLSS